MWIFTGAFFGFALLSKYHGILLCLCIFLYILFSKKRKILLSPKPYVGVVVSFLVFLPNIIWNYQNNWVSYAFQLNHGTGSNFGIEKLLVSIGGQMGAASPFLFFIFVICVISLIRKKILQENDRFLLFTSVPVFIFFCGIGLTGKVLPHWPAVGWWTGALLIAVVILRKISEKGKTGLRWKQWSIFSIGFVVSLSNIIL